MTNKYISGFLLLAFSFLIQVLPGSTFFGQPTFTDVTILVSAALICISLPEDAGATP